MPNFKTTLIDFYKAIKESSLAIPEINTFTWGTPFDFEQKSGERGGYAFAEWNGGFQDREKGNTKIVTMYFLLPDYHGNAPMNSEYPYGDLPSRDLILIEAENVASMFLDAVTDWIKVNNSRLSVEATATLTPEILAFSSVTTGYASVYTFRLGKHGCEEFTPFTDKLNNCKIEC